MIIRSYRRRITNISILILLGVLGICLKSEGLPVYTRSPAEYAFLDIQWGMSPEEVENATGCKIEVLLTDHNKFKTYKQRIRFTDRGKKSLVKYHFFNDKLYKINITKEIKYHKNYILDQLIKNSHFYYKKSSMLDNLTDNNRYVYQENPSIVSIFVNQDTLEKSDILHFILGYKPLINSIKSHRI